MPAFFIAINMLHTIMKTCSTHSLIKPKLPIAVPTLTVLVGVTCQDGRIPHPIWFELLLR